MSVPPFTADEPIEPSASQTGASGELPTVPVSGDLQHVIEGVALPRGSANPAHGFVFMLPQSLTPHALRRFLLRAEQMVNELTHEVNYNTSVSQPEIAREAETTVADVERGYSSWLNNKWTRYYQRVIKEEAALAQERTAEEARRQEAERRRVARIRRRRANFGILASIVVTIAALGVDVTTNLAHRPWQWMLLGACLAIGIGGAIISGILRWDADHLDPPP